MDEVEFDGGCICAHYLSFLLSNYVWDLRTVVDACPYGLCHILGFASLVSPAGFTLADTGKKVAKPTDEL